MQPSDLDNIIADNLALWLDHVIKNMRDDLQRKTLMQFDGSQLGQSINWNMPGFNEGEIVMNDYWPFVEYGVKGVSGSNGDGKYSFKTKRVHPDMVRQIATWTLMHGVPIPNQFMEKAKGNKELARYQFATAIAYGVKVRGLKSRKFFTPNFNEQKLDELGLMIEEDIAKHLKLI